MSDTISLMSDTIQVIEVKRTTELPELSVMFLKRDHPTAEDVAAYYKQLTGREVHTIYYYLTPTLHHGRWHIDLNNSRGAGNDRTEANLPE